jgi:hypothetical protein
LSKQTARAGGLDRDVRDLVIIGYGPGQADQARGINWSSLK